MSTHRPPCTAAALAPFIVLLRDNDAASIKYLEQHAAALKSALGASLFARVEQALSQFDFEDALHAMEEEGKVVD